jgi:hypothetical protein
LDGEVISWYFKDQKGEVFHDEALAQELHRSLSIDEGSCEVDFVVQALRSRLTRIYEVAVKEGSDDE